MNKYEDNLHLCCTFSLPGSPYGSSEGRDGRGGGGGEKKKKVLGFSKGSLWALRLSICPRACAGFVFSAYVRLFACVRVRACAPKRRSLCVTI